MTGMQVHVLDNSEQLLQVADRWNDLWQRSEVTCPPARAELIATWLARFGAGSTFRAIVVEQDDRLIAGLPLVTRKLAQVVPVGGLPRNPWCGAGELLLDPAADADTALRLVAAVLEKLPCLFYRFAFICCGSPHWERFHRTLKARECHPEIRYSHDVVRIEIPENWESYRRTWSANHRNQIRRAWQKLSKDADVRKVAHVPATVQEAEPLLTTFLALEHAGWKGQEGTSLLQSPSAAEFVISMCESLVARRELEIIFLQRNAEVIAAEIVWNSKGVRHGYKCAYDERYKRYAPGQLLLHEIVRDAWETRSSRFYDCIGPASAALRHWRGSTYAVGQMTFAPRPWVGKTLKLVYGKFWPPRRSPAESTSAV